MKQKRVQNKRLFPFSYSENIDGKNGSLVWKRNIQENQENQERKWWSLDVYIYICDQIRFNFIVIEESIDEVRIRLARKI